MAELSLKKIRKSFPGRTVIAGLDLSIASGEFVVLVGPSGCGKSTVLRMIAGLEVVDSGSIWMDGKNVTELPPGEREIGMVFQDYALFPHMTVRENLEFGSKIRKLQRDVIQSRLNQTSEILGLSELLDRKPSQLSGGQRQRVAIGRAMIREPKVFLFDEPLSNLDAQLRTTMRLEIADLHQRLKSTTIYVTHDQEEAMTLADRIVLLKEGEARQVGTPSELYRFPKDRWVASFIGRPSMNFLDGELREVSGQSEFVTHGKRIRFETSQTPHAVGKCVLGFRPHSIKILSGRSQMDQRSACLSAEVHHTEFHGSEVQAFANVGNQRIVLSGSKTISKGEVVFEIETEELHWFMPGPEGMRLERRDEFALDLGVRSESRPLGVENEMAKKPS